jgi:hypothetical protein
VKFNLIDELSKTEANEAAQKFKIEGGNLFSKFEGVRIHLIHELF